jgi:hypothetical protein
MHHLESATQQHSYQQFAVRNHLHFFFFDMPFLDFLHLLLQQSASFGAHGLFFFLHFWHLRLLQTNEEQQSRLLKQELFFSPHVGRVGENVGALDGVNDGPDDDISDGGADGLDDGAVVGESVGLDEGFVDGAVVGLVVGILVSGLVVGVGEGEQSY